MIHSVLIFNRQGKIRLEKWYTALDTRQKRKLIAHLTELIPSRPRHFSNIVEHNHVKYVYKVSGLCDKDYEFFRLFYNKYKIKEPD